MLHSRDSHLQTSHLGSPSRGRGCAQQRRPLPDTMAGARTDRRPSCSDWANVGPKRRRWLSNASLHQCLIEGRSAVCVSAVAGWKALHAEQLFLCRAPARALPAIGGGGRVLRSGRSPQARPAGENPTGFDQLLAHASATCSPTLGTGIGFCRELFRKIPAEIPKQFEKIGSARAQRPENL